jgi:hypothetical protein
MMHRRDLFLAGAGACSLLTTGSSLLAEEATAPSGKEYSVTDALMYRPCAGLCGVPFTEYLNPGATRKSTYALERLLLVPPKGQYITLSVLLQRVIPFELLLK